MVADYFTKPLQGALFYKFRDQIMGVVPMDTISGDHRSVLDNDSKSQNNNKSVVPEKRRVDAEEPRGKKRVQIAQAKGLATTQSWVDVVKSKPKERLKGALAPLIKR
jgi:hypothetical protein